MKRMNLPDSNLEKNTSPITSSSNRRYEKALSLLNELRLLKPIAGFDLLGNITIHTFEYSRHIDMFGLNEIYNRVRNYLISRKNDSLYFKNKLKHFPESPINWDKYRNLPRSNSKRFRHVKRDTKTGFFPPIHIKHGITIVLYFIGDIGGIKLIIDPALLVASHQKGFDLSLYDYTSIAKRDKEFWFEVYQYISQFCVSWHICGNAFDPLEKWSVTRIDLTANIMVDSHYSIKSLLYYYRRTLKHRNYATREFKYSGQNDQTAECRNRSQIFTAYNKTYEQSKRYGKSYDYNIMRLEIKILPRKLFYMKKKIIKSNGYYGKCHLFTLLEEFSKEAPFIMYSAICSIFVDGDFYSEKSFIKKINKLTCHDFIKEEMIIIARMLSSFASDKNIKRMISIYSEAHKSKSIYYRLNALQDNGILPILIENRHSHRYNRLPGMKTLFLSSILNGYIHNISDELEYIETKVMEVMS